MEIGLKITHEHGQNRMNIKEMFLSACHNANKTGEIEMRGGRLEPINATVTLYYFICDSSITGQVI